jgi:methyl-accepting chemotaxis protein
LFDLSAWLTAGVAIATLCVLCLFLFSMAPAAVRPESVTRVEPPSSALHHATGESHTFSSEQTAVARGELVQAKTLISEAVSTLVQSFAGLAAQAESQLKLAESLARGDAGVESHGISFKQFVDEIAQTMSGFVEKTVENSRLAMLLVEQMEQIVSEVNSVNRLLDEIHGITSQTNMLALNAAIEAARAGELGRGFAVVADEVRSLSSRTETFNNQIRDLILTVGTSVTEAEGLINQLASQDMMFTLQAKQRLADTSSRINQLDDQMAGSIESLREGVGQLSHQVGAAVRCLQFQDMTSQLMDHVVRRLDGIDEALNVAEQRASSGGGGVSDHLRDLAERLARSPVKQSAMDSGSIDLF